MRKLKPFVLSTPTLAPSVVANTTAPAQPGKLRPRERAHQPVNPARANGHGAPRRVVHRGR